MGCKPRLAPLGAVLAAAAPTPARAQEVPEPDGVAERVEAPVETYYPGNDSAPTVSGFASLTTTFFWAFYASEGIRQAVGLELQWNTATRSAVGQPWIIEPICGIGVNLTRWLVLTVEINWQKSFGNLGGYAPVNTLQFKPTLTAARPAWFSPPCRTRRAGASRTTTWARSSSSRRAASSPRPRRWCSPWSGRRPSIRWRRGAR
jgi:hypothetical protein